MDLDDMTPAGGGSLRRPVLGPRRQVVATFTPTETPDPGDIWEPFSDRTTEATRGGQQGSPFGRPGHALEHEPLDNAERDAEHTAQNAFDHVKAASTIRAALRPGSIG